MDQLASQFRTMSTRLYCYCGYCRDDRWYGKTENPAHKIKPVLPSPDIAQYYCNNCRVLQHAYVPHLSKYDHPGTVVDVMHTKRICFVCNKYQN
uniref:Uncharacterized protein n=1 Tax=Clandestinovirus TaxID=2831644 RepID=A0A8F8KQP8_9VIRU|nr:hypothetical protein KOM_12_2 [Clandestinovirus]